MLGQALLPTLTCCGRGQVDVQAPGAPHSSCCRLLPDPQEIWGELWAAAVSDPEARLPWALTPATLLSTGCCPRTPRCPGAGGHILATLLAG